MLQHLSVVLALLPSAAAAEVALRETPTHLLLANDALELRIDRATGQLAALVHRPSGLPLLGAAERPSHIDLRTDDGYVGSDGDALRWRCLGHELQPRRDGKRLTVRAQAGDWELATHYDIGPRDAFLARSAVFRYLGGATPTVRGTRFTLAGAACGEAADSFYEILSRWPPEQFPMGALVEGRRRGGTGSHATSRFVGIHNRRRKLSLLAAFHSESERAFLAVLERPGAVDASHYHQVLDRATRSRAIPTGTQHLFVVEGTWDEALAACQGFYGRIGVAVPKAMADRGARSIVYSCHPGGTIDTYFRDVGGIRNLQKTLPRLETLGVNVVWMLPFWEGPVYAPVHYDRLQENWADEAGLRAFVAEAHRRGIKVLLDLIPHGPRPESGLHERHRDWVSTTEDGQMLLWWGCLGCDYAHPGWQSFMADHAADWVRRCDIDGYRVDCSAGGPPNWAAADGRRPSQSGLWGAMGILRQSRAAMEKVKKPIVLLAEAEGVPLNTVADYTYPWTWAFHVLPALRRMPAQEWVPKATRWLQNHQLAMPRGANHIWFLENHDTPRAEMVWGPGTHRALLALCTFLRGAPFLYHEQQVGYEPFLRRLYAIRRSDDLFSIGSVDYLPLADDPRVFTMLRRHGDRRAVVAVSLADEPLDVRLRLPADAQGLVLRDLTDARDVRYGPQDPVPMRPWSCKVLSVEKGERSVPRAPKPARLEVAMQQATAEKTDERVVLKNGVLELRLDRRRGAVIESLRFRDGERSWISGHDLVEGPRKLWPGRPALRQSAPRRLRGPLLVKGGGHVAEAIFKASLGGQLETELRYSISGRGRVGILLTLTPKADIERTRAALTTVLRFPAADAWAVETAEGLVAGEHVLWRADDIPRTGRYWHPTTDRYWESRRLPIHPDLHSRAAIFVANTQRHEHMGISTHASHSDFLQNIVLKERDGEHKELTLRVEWLRGDRPVTLRKGKTYDLSIRLSFGLGRPWEQRDALLKTRRSPTLRAARGLLEVANEHYRIVLARSAGGNIRRLQLKGRDEPIIGDSRIYTDYGLYGTWRDPLGREHKTSAHNENDIEPDVELLRDGERLIVGFTSFFRHPGHGGRSLLSPRMQYRLRYTFDSSPTIGVEAAARPHMSVQDANAFLAHTLRFPAASRWAVASPDGGFVGALAGAKGRLWQSAEHRLGAPRLAIETPGGSAVIADLAPQDALQNLFPHASPGSATVFLAWLDGRPADVEPYWRTVSYTLTVAPGKLDEAVKDLSKLKSWPPGTAR